MLQGCGRRAAGGWRDANPTVRKIPEGKEVDIRHGFLAEQQRLTEERLQAVAAAYDDVLREARSQATKLARGCPPDR